MLTTSRAALATCAARLLDPRRLPGAPVARTDEATSRRTLRPEAGSVAARAPGAFAALAALARRFDRDGVIDLDVVRVDLDALAGEHGDPAVLGLIAQLRPGIARAAEWARSAPPEFVNPGQLTRAVEARLWDAVVASLCAGRTIRLNARLSDVYLEWRKAGRDREVDVITGEGADEWRWIEVKNWRPGRAEDALHLDGLLRQDRGVEEARRSLSPRRIWRQLVFRHAIAPATYGRLRAETAYDEILFIFPDAGPTLRAGPG